MDPLKIPRHQVNSSNIKSIGHDASTNTLTVEFWGGSIYSYYPVTEGAHKALMGAESIGEYFSKHIRGNERIEYKCIKEKTKKK